MFTLLCKCHPLEVSLHFVHNVLGDVVAKIAKDTDHSLCH